MDDSEVTYNKERSSDVKDVLKKTMKGLIKEIKSI